MFVVISAVVIVVALLLLSPSVMSPCKSSVLCGPVFNVAGLHVDVVVYQLSVVSPTFSHIRGPVCSVFAAPAVVVVVIADDDDDEDDVAVVETGVVLLRALLHFLLLLLLLLLQYIH